MPYADPKSEKAIASRRRRAKKTYYKNRQKNIDRSAKYNREHKEQVNERSVTRRSKKLSIEQVLYNNAKMRAKARGVPFDISVCDIVVPKFCPCLGIELVVATGHAKRNSPSLDRKIPHLGYVRGNIFVVSNKANTIKNDATLEEIKGVVAWMERLAESA